MNPRSLVFRLGAWYTLLLSITFLLVGAACFYGLQHYLHMSLRDSLKRRSAQLQQMLMQLPADAVIDREIANRLAPEINNRFVRITRDGTLIYRSGVPSNHSFDPSAVPPAPRAAAESRTSATAVLRDQRLLISTTVVTAASGRYLIEIGLSLEPIEAVLERLLDLLGLLLPALILCAAGGGYLLVSWALRPVDRLSQTAEKMSLRDLTQKLPVVPSGDVLERLANSFNMMLGRLRDSVQTSRQFLADASHELRTPLTVIKGELQELAGAADMTSFEMRERVGSVLEEVARLEYLVSGLLVLSRLDAGEVQRDWTCVDLAELAMSTAEQMRLLAEDRGIEIELSGLRTAEIRGDRARLKQIIVNLLDNAIRFTPRGGKVELRTTAGVAECVLELWDNGIGIPAPAISRVFDRFYRVDEARARDDDGGAGLGLSIVKSICSLHGAEVDVESTVSVGSKFRVRFPRLASGAL
jgi:heavy metal sensor kinase